MVVDRRIVWDGMGRDGKKYYKGTRKGEQKLGRGEKKSFGKED